MKEAKEAAFTLALAWCRTNGKGAKACLKANPELKEKGVNPHALHKRLKQQAQGLAKELQQRGGYGAMASSNDSEGRGAAGQLGGGGRASPVSCD